MIKAAPILLPILVVFAAEAFGFWTFENSDPIRRRAMVATCAAHLVGGDAVAPIDISNVTGLIEQVSADETLGRMQRKRLRELLADLRTPEILSVAQYLRGAEIDDFARGIDAVTARVDEVFRPHLKPPQPRLEVLAKKIMRITAGLGAIGFQFDLTLTSPVAFLIGAVSYTFTEFVSVRVGRWRERRGWSSTDADRVDGRRLRFERATRRRNESTGTIALGASEYVTADFARALRDADTPEGLGAEAIADLTSTRDRFHRVMLARGEETLQLDYIYLPEADGAPVLITVVRLVPKWSMKPPGPRRRRRTPAKEPVRSFEPGLIPVGA